MKISTLILTSAVLLASAGLAIAQDAGAAAGGGAGGGRGGAMRAACGDDITKLCAGKTGRDIRACLMDNKDKASAGCQSALAAMPAGGGAAP
jgi:hypothetical protein